MKNTILTINYAKYIKYFLIVFACLNIVFLYYHKIFFIGNHDWDWVKGTTQVLSLSTGLFEGRYGKFILNVALFGGQILPLLNAIIAFALLALGCCVLTQYWNLPLNITSILVALVPAISPFILGWLYFPINILGNFSLVALVAIGLYLSDSIKLRYKSIAICCFLIALGVYPSAIEMMIIVACIRFIINAPKNKKDYLPPLTTIVLSLFLFKAILYGMTIGGIIYTGHYNVQTAGIGEIINRLPQMIILAINQLVITLPFFPMSLKLSGLLLLVMAMIISIRTAQDKFQITILWLISIGATVLSAALSAKPEDVAYMPRVNFYGLNFLYAGSLAVLLTKTKIWRNIGLLLSVIYLSISINQDILAEKVWQFGKTAEENLVDRVSARVEERHNSYVELVPVIAGEISLRPRYYNDKYDINSPYILEKSFVIRHIPSGIYNFYAPENIFTGYSQISNLTPMLYDFIVQAHRPWPSDKALYTDDGYAVILLTTEGIQAIQAQLPH